MELRFRVVSQVIGSEGYFNVNNHNANTTEPHGQCQILLEPFISHFLASLKYDLV
jgi:hypothetical protein